MSNGTGESLFYSTVNAQWPQLARGQVEINPPRNGMDRKTGKMLSGWLHVEQSMELIFATPFHERVLRRWVGSFVPHILGESAVERIITRFYWAIATALDLWEPCYKVRRVYFMGDALSGWSPLPKVSAADLLRQGSSIFRTEGVYFPRGHLADYAAVGSRPAEVPLRQLTGG